MNYQIYCLSVNQGWLRVKLSIETYNQKQSILQLPVWRPGRYEKANYAKNIKNIKAFDGEENPIDLVQINNSRWQCNTKNLEKLNLQYDFYARQLDAGGSWWDEYLCYLNFINCLIYDVYHLDEGCRVQIDYPDTFYEACPLTVSSYGEIKAENYYQLVDSPFIASPDMVHWHYQVQGSNFHLWFANINKEKLLLNETTVLNHFHDFTYEQIKTMTSFPGEDYHFMYIVLPYRHFHGVEHQNGTVITIGAADELSDPEIYKRFLSISSHELFHTWNVTRLKPKELIPYDFSRKSLFSTGFMAEGITTYYGDLSLLRSGVWDINQYFDKLNLLLNQHFKNQGRHYISLTESSLDMWVIGYRETSIPNRKVSIYTKGALVALLWDLTIRESSGFKKSLDDLVLYLWNYYYMNSTGYTFNDLIEVSENISGTAFNNFFEYFIKGTEPIESELNRLLQKFGCKLTIHDNENILERKLGFLVNQEKAIIQIAPESPAEEHLTHGDEIIAVDGRKVKPEHEELQTGWPLHAQNSWNVFIKRGEHYKEMLLEAGAENYFPNYELKMIEHPSQEQQKRLISWLGNHFA